MKPNKIKTQTLICTPNNNITTVQTFAIQLDANYKWVSHVALKTAVGDTSYMIQIGDDNGPYITNVHSAIVEMPEQVPVLDRFYALNVVNGKQQFTVNITRLTAVAVTGAVHVVFRLEDKCPS
jgi:hypothetical protein